MMIKTRTGKKNVFMKSQRNQTIKGQSSFCSLLFFLLVMTWIDESDIQMKEFIYKSVMRVLASLRRRQRWESSGKIKSNKWELWNLNDGRWSDDLKRTIKGQLCQWSHTNANTNFFFHFLLSISFKSSLYWSSWMFECSIDPILFSWDRRFSDDENKKEMLFLLFIQCVEVSGNLYVALQTTSAIATTKKLHKLENEREK